MIYGTNGSKVLMSNKAFVSYIYCLFQLSILLLHLRISMRRNHMDMSHKIGDYLFLFFVKSPRSTLDFWWLWCRVVDLFWRFIGFFEKLLFQAKAVVINSLAMQLNTKEFKTNALLGFSSNSNFLFSWKKFQSVKNDTLIEFWWN